MANVNKYTWGKGTTKCIKNILQTCASDTSDRGRNFIAGAKVLLKRFDTDVIFEKNAESIELTTDEMSALAFYLIVGNMISEVKIKENTIKEINELTKNMKNMVE